MGAQRALGRRPKSPRRWTPPSWRSWIAWPAGCVPPAASAGPSSCGCASTTSPGATRSHTLSEATAHTQTILVTARGLLSAALPTIERRGVTLVGVTLGNLENDDAMQLAFPFDRQRALDATLDDLRDRFGTSAITRAVLLGRDQGISVPLLPD